MVRVFSAYQFGGQIIHRIQDDIRAACLIDDSHLILAKCNHLIEILTLHKSLSYVDISNNASNETSTNTVNYLNDNQIQTKFSFPTVDEVIQMVYCKFGNYIATIERKILNSSEQTFCRIYTNWPTNDTNTQKDQTAGSFNVTIRARIAGKVTPSSNNVNCLEVIEIPISKLAGNQSHLNSHLNYFVESDEYDSTSSSFGLSASTGNTNSTATFYPHQIAACQQTGTFICAIQRCIKLYKFIECTNDNTHFKYIDFMELPFEIDLGFVPIYLSINEHIVGCGNREFMCVFKLLERNYSNAVDSDDAISANSLTTSSELSGIGNVGDVNNFMSGGNYISEQKYIANAASNLDYIDDSFHQVFDYKNISKKFLSSIKSNISSTFDHQTSDQYGCKLKSDKNRGSTELRPIFIENGIPLCSLRHVATAFLTTSDEFYKDYVLKPLLQIKQHDAINDPFKCLVLKPIYAKCIRTATSKDHSDAYDNSNNIFRSFQNRTFVGISILLATINDGYLYQFTNNEKWIVSEEDLQSNCLIATYPFTSQIIDVCITDYVIHALTDHGIETYTHRIGHKLFSSAYEYGLRDDPFIVEACPRVEEPICLIGLRPFLGIQRMLSTQQNLILLANSNEAPSTNFKLSNSSTTDNDSISNWTIYDLKLAQADVLYRDFMELANSHIPDSPKMYAHLVNEAHMILRIAKEISFNLLDAANVEKSDTIKRLFLESCLKSADVCVMSENRDEYCFAYPYYTMGEITTNEAYDRIVALLNHNDGGDGSGKRSANGAIYTLKLMITKETGNAEEIGHRLTATHSENQSFGEKLLEFFAQNAPNEIAMLGLNSMIFRDFMSAKMCEVIARSKSESGLTSEDKLCIILDLIRTHQRDRITELLMSFSEMDLYISLITHWSILFDTTKIKKTGKFVTTFSELTESYLLPAVSVSQTIRTATLAIFKYLLVDTNILNIELVLKLFMDYLASHFGQVEAYKSAQSILENILEAYFHRLYVVRGYAESLSSTSNDAFTKTSNRFDGHFKSNNLLNNNSNNNDSLCSQASSDSERTSSSAATNVSDNSLDQLDGLRAKRLNRSASMHNRIGTITPTTGAGISSSADDDKRQPLFGSSFHSDALKILIRIYLGALKLYTGTDKSVTNDCDLSLTTKAIQLKYVKFLRENFNKCYSNHVYLAQLQQPLDGASHLGPKFNRYSDKRMQCGIQFDSDHSIKLQKTPILFLARRLIYLNRMPPIGDNEYFKDLFSTKIWLTGDFNCDGDERRKAIVTVLKLQALLSSGKLTRDILHEIIHFIEANAPFIGVDSFLTILMPFDICIDYMIEFCPEHLLDYATSSILDDQKWQQVLLRITMQCKRITQNRSQIFYEQLLKDHLDYLVHTKRLSEVLNIFPVKYIGDSIDKENNDENINETDNNFELPRDHKINENNDQTKNISIKTSDYVFFTHYLKMAIDLDRSERLSEMIKTTGFQLYNTFVGSNLNSETVKGDN